MAKKKPATERFAAAVEPFGFVPEIKRFEKETRTAAQAAEQLECSVAQIVKSLLFFDGDEPLMVLTSGAHRVDPKKVSSDLKRSDADGVRAITGFAIGGTPPFGHLAPIRTLVDQGLMEFDQVWGAAGAPDSVFPISPTQLVELTGGTVADIAE